MEKQGCLNYIDLRRILGFEKMRKQTFDKIKKILAVLLAVFLVVTLTAVSVSAAGTKDAKDNIKKEVVIKSDGSGLTKEQETELGNRLLDLADNNLIGWGNGLGNDRCNNWWDNDRSNNWWDNGRCNNCWDNDWDEDWDED